MRVHNRQDFSGGVRVAVGRVVRARVEGAQGMYPIQPGRSGRASWRKGQLNSDLKSEE